MKKRELSPARISYNFNFFINNLLREKTLIKGELFNKPHFISLMIEDRCCLKCRQCDVWKNSPAPEKEKLTLRQQKKILLKLKRWMGGTFGLNISGGEPFLNEKIFSLIQFAAQNKILVHVNTNGVLINRKIAKKIVKSGVDAISISIDSFKPEVHDNLRGVKGTCKKALQAVKYLNKLRQQVKPMPILNIGTIIVEQNLTELVEMAHWVKKNKLNGIFFQPLRHNFASKTYNDLWYKNSDLWPKNSKQVKLVINELIDLKNRGWPILNPVRHLEDCKLYYKDPLRFSKEKQCYVGIGNFIITVRGDVLLCFEMKPIGNIIKQTPEEIWKGDKASKQRKEIKKCSKSCRVALCNSPGEVHELFLNEVKKSKALFNLS